MTTDTQQPTTSDHKNTTSFGGRLQSAREALGLERKEAADQLRLTEKIIIMMEKDRYPSDLPVTFIKGYLRAYAKLLQIPDNEVKKAVEPIKQKATNTESAPILIAHTAPVTSGSYFMQLLTYLIIFTLLALVAVWWYTHNPMTRNEQASVLDNMPPSQPAVSSANPPAQQPPALVPPQTVVNNNALPGQPATEQEKLVEATANAAQSMGPVSIENNSATVAPPTNNNTNPADAVGMQATVKPQAVEPSQEDMYEDEDDGDDSEV